MQELYGKLSSLVRGYPDPTLRMYVVENLGKPIPPHSKYYHAFMHMRNELSRNTVFTQWNPQKPWGPRLPANRFAENVRMARAQIELERQQVEAMQKAAQDAEYKAFMLRQLEQMAKQAEMIDGLLRELAKEDNVVIANKLLDPEPTTRWLAVQIAGKKRLPLEHNLINLLADRHPLVRQAAHDALFRLSRGTNFGPDAKGTAKQIASSQRAWREWLAIQTDARLSATTPTPMTMK